MRTQSKSTIELATQLLETIELRKELEKNEKEMKERIKSIMGNEKILEAGSIFITLDDRERTDIDKKRMTQDLGMELIKQYETQTSFQIMTVRSK